MLFSFTAFINILLERLIMVNDIQSNLCLVHLLQLLIFHFNLIHSFVHRFSFRNPFLNLTNYGIIQFHRFIKILRLDFKILHSEFIAWIHIILIAVAHRTAFYQEIVWNLVKFQMTFGIKCRKLLFKLKQKIHAIDLSLRGVI